MGLHTSIFNVFVTSNVSRKAGENLRSSIHGDRAHLMCPELEETFNDRLSAGIYAGRSLKRRDRFENGGVHAELSCRKTTGDDARHLPGADGSQASRWKRMEQRQRGGGGEGRKVLTLQPGRNRDAPFVPTIVMRPAGKAFPRFDRQGT